MAMNEITAQLIPVLGVSLVLYPFDHPPHSQKCLCPWVVLASSSLIFRVSRKLENDLANRRWQCIENA